MKKIALLMATVLVVSCLTACAKVPQQKPTDSIKIGVSVYDQHDTFVRVMTDHLQKIAREKEQAEGLTISILYGNADQSQIAQNNQVDGFIRDGCDVICVNLVDRTDASAIIDKADASGVPILFFNRELVEEDLERSDNLYYVGAVAEESGVLQAEIVLEHCWKDFDSVDKNGDGVLQYVMLEGEPGHQDAILRTESSISTVKEHFSLERLEDEIANWNAAQAEKRMTAWLEVHGTDIEVVFANNDEMALGAISALTRTKSASSQMQDYWPLIVGIDGTPAGLQAVLKSGMAGTVYNDGQGQSRALLELSLSLVRGTSLPPDIELQNGKYIRLPYQKVTMENVAQFIALG